MNQGENVCFFNSVVQFLYTFPAFRVLIQQLSPTNAVVSEVKNLFGEFESSNVPVRTSDYVQNYVSVIIHLVYSMMHMNACYNYYYLSGYK